MKNNLVKIVKKNKKIFEGKKRRKEFIEWLKHNEDTYYYFEDLSRTKARSFEHHSAGTLLGLMRYETFIKDNTHPFKISVSSGDMARLFTIRNPDFNEFFILLNRKKTVFKPQRKKEII